MDDGGVYDSESPRRGACSLHVVQDLHGQASVEYLLVGLVLIAIILAFSALCGKLADGTFSAHISESASHVLSNGALSTVGDIAYF